ncbi:Double zinc ribbon [compost metagenome]
MNRVLVLKTEIEANLEQIEALGDGKHCKSCDSSVPAEARFCPNCGHTFEAPREPQVPQEPVAEASPLALDKKDTGDN